MTIAQYSFKLGMLSTPSKIVGGAGAPPPPLLPPIYCGSICPPLSGESIIVYMAEHLKNFQFLLYFSVLIFLSIIMVTL